MARTPAKTAQQPTTAQQLGSLVKSARDIMRKDKGMTGDLDRLPMLTWIMFLRFLDDMEQIEESRAKLVCKKYRPTIEPPYRWRDWAANAEQGITGPRTPRLPQSGRGHAAHVAKEGPGCSPTSVRSPGPQRPGRPLRTVVATVFQGVMTRMTSGYLLRDVINKVGEASTPPPPRGLFTLGTLYESMLKEMRDAAGDNGEFYTPRAGGPVHGRSERPAARAKPCWTRLAATGGFLVEAYTHLAKPSVKQSRTARMLQEETIFGGEAKPLPYLLGQMNLLLHGLEYPQIDPGNSLSSPWARSADRDRAGRAPGDESALRGRGGAGHSGQFSAGQADGRDGAVVPAAHHAQVATTEA